MALDGSDSSMRTVDYVARMLTECDCEVVLAHVIRAEEEKALKETGKKISPVFDIAKAHLINCGIDSNQISSKIISGALSRAGAIVREAKDGGYCTIVIGRRGMSKVREFVMGRVSNKVVQLGRGKVVWVVN